MAPLPPPLLLPPPPPPPLEQEIVAKVSMSINIVENMILVSGIEWGGVH